jgi:hypothetical protein
MPTTFTAKQQAMRTMLASLSPAQFAQVRAYLDAVRVQTDARLAQIEAERAILLARKQKLDGALRRLSQTNAFEDLRQALNKGERLRAPAITSPKKPGKSPGKRPAKRPGRRPK